MSRVSKILLCALLVSGFAHAQTPINWGEQAKVAREKYALFVDLVKSGQYHEAVAPHDWLLENTPDLSASLYQYGARIYEGLVDKEADEVQKAAYQVKALEMYDLRIKYFGEEAYVLNRKVIPAYKFYRKEKTRYAELYDLFNKAFELNQNDFFDNSLVAFMDVVRRYKLTGGEVSDEKAIEIYTAIISVLDHKRGQVNDPAKLDRIADQVDRVFAGTIGELNCDLVEHIFGTKFHETRDVKLSKKIFQLMLKGKCTDRPLAFEVAKVIHEEDPSFGIAKFLGNSAVQQGDQEAALTFYTQAISLTEDNLKKADIYMNLARMDAQDGRRVAARKNARKSLAFDPSSKEAYTLIGNLYMQSFEDCKKGEKRTHDYAIFIAAHKMFELAGDVENAMNVMQYFPSMQDIFNDEYQEGQIYEVGCWINESVKLMRRPE
ncbi:MAG: hypothetical protein R8G66_32690 [Cytophagales bacterium]|nr:hypothetical protein [Cytophagales bacterium]